jgi:hypothetical protein
VSLIPIICRRDLQVAADEASQARLAQVGVNTWGTSRSTTLTPGDNAELDAGGGVDDGATTVTLARILSTLAETGAEHGGSNASRAVVGVASGAGDDGNIDLEQVHGQRAAARGSGSPRLVLVQISNCFCIRETHQPATVRPVPAAGSEPDAASLA